MTKRDGTVVVNGMLLPATTEPDLEGHVFDLDGIPIPSDPVPLHWDIDPAPIGSAVLERTATGIVATAQVPDPAMLRAPMDDLAFGIEGVIEASETLPYGARVIQRARITGVSLMPSALALTRGTRVSVQVPKEDDDAPSV